MNIEELLIEEHSKAQAIKIAQFVGNDRERFDELMKLFLDGRIRIHQRASMPLCICADKHPHLIIPYLQTMLSNLKNPVHDAVVRNTIRLFQNIELPEDMWGEVWEICFEYLVSPRYPVAIRVFAMTVLYNICRELPELTQELKVVLEDQMPYGSAGFISRGKKILAKLKVIEAKSRRYS
jgi:hypothetical protein